VARSGAVVVAAVGEGCDAGIGAEPAFPSSAREGDMIAVNPMDERSE